MGAIDNSKLTAIGDAVNLASRIESANKQVGTTLLISEATYTHVKDLVSVQRCFRVNLKGKSGEYPLYEIDGIDPSQGMVNSTIASESNPIRSNLVRAIWQWLKGAFHQLRNLFGLRS